MPHLSDFWAGVLVGWAVCTPITVLLLAVHRAGRR